MSQVSTLSVRLETLNVVAVVSLLDDEDERGDSEGDTMITGGLSSGIGEFFVVEMGL